MEPDPQPPPKSVSGWLLGMRQHDEAAFQAVWQRYYQALVREAQKKLRGISPGFGGDEDVAAAALKSCCEAIASGKYPDIADRDSLWKLLLAVATHKAGHLRERQQTAKRGGGQVRSEGILAVQGESVGGLDQFVDNTSIDPADAAAIHETIHLVRDLLAKLPPELQTIVQMLLDGHSINDIADQQQVSPMTIRRKLRHVAGKWRRSLE